MTYEHRTSQHWSPFIEWTIDAPTPGPDAYESDALAIFTHAETGESIKTGIFPLRENVWAFRFANSAPGDWSFKTTASIDALSGHSGTITVEPDPTTRGTLAHSGHWWTWSESGDVIVPQLAMYASPDAFHNQPGRIDADIETFFDGHGFNGFHVPVFCRWLDIDKETNPEFDDPDPLPDHRTFEALELLIRKTYAAGGFVHIWLWGDNDRGHQMTPMREDWGGKNGKVARRLERYIAARLGPVNGWSMGYGFDLEHWVEEEDLKRWHDTMTAELGWPHLLGGRSGRPKDGPELLQIYDGLDYAGYTHHRPTYEDYRAVVAAHPDKPVFSEDRFRIRESDRFRFKDYTEEATRRGLWHSTMAGGVANIWGKMEEGAQNGQSVPYQNAAHLVTASRFFASRLTTDARPDDDCSDGCALRSSGRLLIYKEDCDIVHLTLNHTESPTTIVCVDTIADYREIAIALNSDHDSIHLPHRSDWAIEITLGRP